MHNDSSNIFCLVLQKKIRALQNELQQKHCHVSIAYECIRSEANAAAHDLARATLDRIAQRPEAAGLPEEQPQAATPELKPTCHINKALETAAPDAKETTARITFNGTSLCLGGNVTRCMCRL